MSNSRSALISVSRYVLRDISRSRFLLVYGITFLLLSEALVRFVGVERVLPALINVVVPLVPLVSVIFALSYVHQSMSTVEMLLTQPIRRSMVFGGLYIGMSLPLAIVPAVALGLPLAIRGVENFAAFATLVAAGLLLAVVWVGLGYWMAVRFRDRVTGLAVALFAWLFLVVGYDGIVLWATRTFADYPLEVPLLGAMMLNPVDLARVALLTVTDLSAMMGYTGAVFVRFFGSPLGVALCLLALLAWVLGPGLATRSRFLRRDF